MRKRFELSPNLGALPISEVKIPLKSRDELPPVLLALQTIFTSDQYHSAMFEIIDPVICGGKKQTGREGMTIWEVIVLSVIRMSLNTNYDRLHWIANNDRCVGQLMGIEPDDHGFSGIRKTYSLTALKENISLLKSETIDQINDLVLKVGQDYLKKKDQETVKLKADSYVVKTNVHFPTDYNLLWDACRKVTEISVKLAGTADLSGWRKGLDWKKRIKARYRTFQRVKKSGGKNKVFRLKKAAIDYLNLVEILAKKTSKFLVEFKAETLSQMLLYQELEYYYQMLLKHSDLLKRRIIKEETIAHSEKMFSLFEPHTKWISKGKAGIIAELGQKQIIVTDQNHFIVYHQLIGDKPDSEFTIPVAKKLKQLFGERLYSLSYDKGFSSKNHIDTLEKLIPKAIIKQKGKATKERKEIERNDEFRRLSNEHQAVESNINQLEYNGLDKCPDKGEKNFKRYVSLAVLSCNMHRLGKLIMQKKMKEKPKGRQKQAA